MTRLSDIHPESEKYPQVPAYFAQLSTSQAGLIQARAYRVLMSFLSNHLQRYTLSVSEWTILGLARHDATLRPSEIADAVGVKRPVVAKILRQLERKGWAVLRVDPSDSRAMYVHLSAGRAQEIDGIERALRDELQVFLQDISRPDLQAYLETLKKIAAKTDV